MSHDFLSGDAGDVTHPWRRLKRGLGELGYDALDRAALTGRRMDRLAAAQAPRRVLVVGVYRPGSLLPAALRALASERHSVRLAFGAVGEPEPELAEHTLLSGLEGGKFENLNRLLEAAGATERDWLVAIDDDLRLPPRFLDRFVALCERFALDLAQPAQTLRSHSAWKAARRRPLSLVRETRFVEIGPLTAFGAAAAAELLPFPELRFGWGLDLHWAALAAERGWRLGVVDALPGPPRGAAGGRRLRPRRRDRRGRRLPGRPPLSPERPRRRHAGRAPAGLRCGCSSSAPTCAPAGPSATGPRCSRCWPSAAPRWGWCAWRPRGRCSAS